MNHTISLWPSADLHLPETPLRSQVLANASSRPSSLRKTRSMFYSNRRQDLAGQPIAEIPARQPGFQNAPPEYNTCLHDLQAPLGPSGSIDAARDRILTDFQTGSGRQRTSFALAPFLKRRDKSRSASSEAADQVTFDSSEGPIDSLASFKKSESKGRAFSGIFKSKIKKVFRKSSIIVSDLPVQHVEAKRLHFSISTPATDEADESTTAVDYNDNSIRRASGGTVSATERSKSRVTSWTDSSAGDTIGSKDFARLSVIREVSQPRLTTESRDHPAALLQEEFLQRLESKNRADFPVEPQRVYSALLKEIEKKNILVDDAQRIDIHKDGSVSRSALGTLPSQRHRHISISSLVMLKPTIRKVSSDVNSAHETEEDHGKQQRRMRRGSGIGTDNNQGQTHPGLDVPTIYFEEESRSSSQLCRSKKAMLPSAEQIELRVKKARDRWSAPLQSKQCAGDFITSQRSYTCDKYLQQPQERDVPVSPSVYSTKEDDDPVHDSPRKSSKDVYSDRSKLGTAVVLDTCAVKHVIGSSPEKPKPRSARSSRD